MATLLLATGCPDDPPPADPDGSSSDGSTTVVTPPDPTTTTSDSSSTTEASSTGLDSTGPAVECGNGVVEEGEECDDGNVVDDDACYSNCTIPFVELWTVTHDEGNDDVAAAAVFDAEGNLYVLGYVQVEGQGYDLWVRQYTPDGREGFTWTYGGAIGGDDLGRAMAWHPSGDLIVVGSETTDTGDDILVMRFSPVAQSTVWIDRHDGTSMGIESTDEADFATGVAVDGDGNVLVSGTERVDMQEFDIWLRKYDGDGNILWTQGHDGPVSGNDTADAVLVDGNGDVYLVGDEEVAANDPESWIRKYDTDGNELWTATVPNVFFSRGVIDGDGNPVLVGVDVDNTMNVNMYAGRFDPDFAVLDSTQVDGPSGAYDAALHVAVDATGEVYIGGYVTVIGQIENIWAGRYMSDLSLRRWSISYNNDESNLADVARAVAVSDDGSRVAVVGYESVIFQDRNVWVRMLQNNPAP